MTFESPPSVRPGDVVGGKYRVERVLGAGGMGCVVVARHVRFDDRVALKVLHEEIAERPEIVERFMREGRAARQIRSEHVVQVTDVDLLANGAPYLVMEYLDGSDLAGMLQKRGPLPIDTVLEWVLQASEALAEAHTRGIVHRDLKPANLFLTKRSDGSNCVKVLDFGISKIADPYNEAQNLTQTSSMVGTPIYMSPEQLRMAKDVDARADIWSIGVILFELLAGKPPFKADTLAALALMIALDEPADLREVRPDVPEGLAAVIGKCLAKERNERYSNIGEVALALAPYAPQRAKISIERIGRVTGMVARSTAPPPSAQPVPSIEIPKHSDPAPLSHQPTVVADSRNSQPSASKNEKPISLDLVAPAPRASAPRSTPEPARLGSTIGGTSLATTEASSRARLVPWIAGGALLALSAAALVIFFAGRAPEKTPAAVPPPVATSSATNEEPAPAPVIAEPAPSPKVSAQPTAPSAPWLKTPTAKVKPPTTAPPVGSTKPPQSKSNEDY